MAIDFSGATAARLRDSIPGLVSTNWSISCFVKLDATAGYVSVCDTYGGVFQFAGGQLIVYDGGDLGGNLTLNTSDWYFCALVANGTGASGWTTYARQVTSALALNAVNASRASATSIGAGGALEVAHSQFGEDMTGWMFGLRVWQVALTAAELELERRSLIAVRRQNLAREYLLDDLANILVDRTGTQNLVNVSGTPSGRTVVNNPPLSWAAARRKYLHIVSAPSGTSGTIAASLPAPTALVAGTPVATGGVAATLPSPSAALAGTPVQTGAVTAQVPAPSATAAGTPVLTGTGSATLPAPSASASGTVGGPTQGTIAGTLPAPSAEAAGTPVASAEVTGTLPAPSASAAGTPIQVAALAAELPAPTATAHGTPVAVGTLAAELPAPSAALAGSPDNSVGGTVAATLPPPSAALAGSPVASGAVAAVLPTPTAAASGVVSDAVQGQVVATLPAPNVAAQGTPVLVGAAAAVLPAPTAQAAGDLPGATPAAIVARWTFDHINGSTVLGTYPLTAHNAPEQVRGRLGKAIRLERRGADPSAGHAVPAYPYLHGPADAALRERFRTGEWSIAAWLKPLEQGVGTSGDATLLYFGGTDGALGDDHATLLHLLRVRSTGAIRFLYSSAYGQMANSFAGGVAASEANHVVLSKTRVAADDFTFRLYLGGFERAVSTGWPYALGGALAELYFGTSRSSGQYGNPGSDDVSDFRIYDKPLTAAEVLALAREPQLWARWMYDDQDPPELIREQTGYYPLRAHGQPERVRGRFATARRFRRDYSGSDSFCRAVGPGDADLAAGCRRDWCLLARVKRHAGDPASNTATVIRIGGLRYSETEADNLLAQIRYHEGTGRIQISWEHAAAADVTRFLLTAIPQDDREHLVGIAKVVEADGTATLEAWLDGILRETVTGLTNATGGGSALVQVGGTETTTFLSDGGVYTGPAAADLELVELYLGKLSAAQMAELARPRPDDVGVASGVTSAHVVTVETEAVVASGPTLVEVVE